MKPTTASAEPLVVVAFRQYSNTVIQSKKYSDTAIVISNTKTCRSTTANGARAFAGLSADWSVVISTELRDPRSGDVSHIPKLPATQAAGFRRVWDYCVTRPANPLVLGLEL